MPAPVSKEEKERRLKALAATVRPGHPNGCIKDAAKVLKIGPGALAKWLTDNGVRAQKQPAYTREQCIEALQAAISRHKRIPSREEFVRGSVVCTAWKTHWPTWREFLEGAGVIGDSAKILLLDIETAPNRAYFWGGTYKQNINPDWIDAAGYVLCWTAKWLDSKEVHFHRLKNGNHKALLRPMHKLLNEAHAVVHYNGQKFDVPTLNKEFLKNGFTPPAPYKQVDLLKTMWSTFLFPSNKLDYICKALDIGQKLRHEGPQLWMDCMANDPEAWSKMEAYNRRDVELLELLYRKLMPWIKGHPNRAAMSGMEVCTTCGSHDYEPAGTYLANQLKYEQFKCGDCGTFFRGTKSINPKKEKRFSATA